MGGKYERASNVVVEDLSKIKKNKFNWLSLGVWLISLVLSLIPIYLSFLQHLQEYGTIDDSFWFNCFVEYDILWVFATFLLFTCINPITCMINRKARPGWVTGLTVLGGVLFIFTEATWLFFKYRVISYATWPITLGFVLIALTVVISTPLQINFIKGEG